jgi:hypothetical protein
MLRTVDAKALFVYLARRFERSRELVAVYQSGIDTRQLRQTLHHARRWVRHWLGLDLTYRQARIGPYIGATKLVVRRIKAHLETRHAVAIVGLEAKTGHWSVVTGWTQTRFRLSDSDDGLWLPFQGRRSRRWTWHAGCIDPTSIFLVRVQPLPALHSPSRAKVALGTGASAFTHRGVNAFDAARAAADADLRPRPRRRNPQS